MTSPEIHTVILPGIPLGISLGYSPVIPSWIICGIIQGNVPAIFPEIRNGIPSVTPLGLPPWNSSWILQDIPPTVLPKISPRGP